MENKMYPIQWTRILAFKEKAIAQAQRGMKSVKIFNEAGLTDDILEKKHIYSAMKTFKREAKSPEGLRESKGKSKEDRIAAFAKEDLSKKQTNAEMNSLQRIFPASAQLPHNFFLQEY